NETMSTNCENMSSSPPTTGDDIAINAPEPPAEEDVPEPPAEEDFAINPFSIPLEEDDDGDGEEEEDGDGDGNGVE
ncbi:MAG: hypothetical protein M3156_03065, partial [Thermoproteota archaeon]|nr:hypothetical protein [Thermoproteota archaeon]